MKPSIAVVLTAAALAMVALGHAGPSAAQDQAGVSIPLPSATPLPGKDVGYKPGLVADLLAARYRLRQACAADMIARCADKDGTAADRCLEYHRLSFTLPCKKAIAAFERAAPPRMPYETLTSLAPISGPIPPADQRPLAAPTHAPVRAGSGD
jgi:hypothetical protein